MLLSIVVPCFNEVHNIFNTCNYLVTYMNNINIDSYEIIFVNDGSTDDTLVLLKGIVKDYKNVHYVSYKRNKGKGYAIKRGILHSKGDYVLFMDADLSTNLNAIESCLSVLNKHTNEQLCIIGTRKGKGSIIEQDNGLLRNIISLCCTKIVNLVTHLNVTDSQCGFKLFDKKTALFISANQYSKRWAFDVEYLYLVRKEGIPIIEIPIIWSNELRSNVKPFRSSVSFVLELCLLKLHSMNEKGNKE